MTAANPSPPSRLLRCWLARQSSPAALAWFDETRLRLAQTPADRDFHIAIGQVPRRLGKADLVLDEADLEAAAQARAGWSPVGWSVDQAARIALLLDGEGDPGRQAARLERLAGTADVGELVAFYRGLPLYPGPEAYLRLAAEGLRSNMTAAFEAVAHGNPYPMEHFGDDAWNQMILKALFVGSALHPILGLEARANADLVRMLTDYARERSAAGRPISHEIWLAAGPYADSAEAAELLALVPLTPRCQTVAACGARR